MKSISTKIEITHPFRIDPLETIHLNTGEQIPIPSSGDEWIVNNTRYEVKKVSYKVDRVFMTIKIEVS